MKTFLRLVVICFTLILSTTANSYRGNFHSPKIFKYIPINEECDVTINQYDTGIGFIKTKDDGSTIVAFQGEKADNYVAYAKRTAINRNSPGNTINSINGIPAKAEIIFGSFNLNTQEDLLLSFWYLWETETSLDKDLMTVEISKFGIDGPYDVILNTQTIRNHHQKKSGPILKILICQPIKDRIFLLSLSLILLMSLVIFIKAG